MVSVIFIYFYSLFFNNHQEKESQSHPHIYVEGNVIRFYFLVTSKQKTKGNKTLASSKLGD